MLQEESYFRITSAPRLCSPLGEGESAVCIKDENVKGKSSSSAGAEKKQKIWEIQEKGKQKHKKDEEKIICLNRDSSQTF